MRLPSFNFGVLEFSAQSLIRIRSGSLHLLGGLARWAATVNFDPDDSLQYGCQWFGSSRLSILGTSYSHTI
jgi:hypothetical protein